MFQKRGDLSITSSVVIILALLVLVVVLIIFSNTSNGFLVAIKQQLGFGQTLLNESTKQGFK